MDYLLFPLSPVHQTQNFTPKQQLYLTKQKHTIQPLNEYELYVLNDYLEMSSSSDSDNNQPEKNLNNLKLPTKQRKKKLIMPRKRRVTIAEKLRNEMNQLIRQFKEKEKSFVFQTTFSPDGFGKLIWDLICMCLIFYEIIAIPFKISFEVQISDAWDTIVNNIFIADILITFNTSFYEKGVLITKRKKIAINYLKFWFWLDALSCFPYEEVITYAIQSEQKSTTISSSLRMLRFIRFVKVVRLLRLAKLKVIFDKMEEFLQLSATLAAIISFMRLNFFVLFWSHWLGCIFHFIAQNEEENNWLMVYKLDITDWTVRYVNSVYWAVTTMNTVGYGDLSPQTPLERVFGVMFLLVATVVFSFTMNTIGSALQAIEDKRQEQRKKISQINNYMKKMNLDLTLQNRVRKYLTYIWETDHSQNLQVITSQLSQSLKYEFTIFVNGSILSYCPPIYEQFSQQFLKELTQLFEELMVIPDEYIFLEHTSVYQQHNLYFIQDGQVDIFIERTKKCLTRLEKGDYFGEVTFFTDMQFSATAKSVNFSGLIYINRQKFLLLVRKYPKDLESFCQIKDGLIFYNDYQSLQLNCYACLRDDHLVRDCPSVHFTFNFRLYNSIKQDCYKKMQKQIIRKDIVQFHPWVDFVMIEQSAIRYSKNVQKGDWEDYQIIDSCCDFESVAEKQKKLPIIGKLKSHFRQDRKRVRMLKKFAKEQQTRIARLSSQSQMNNEFFQQLGNLLTTGQISASFSMKNIQNQQAEDSGYETCTTDQNSESDLNLNQLPIQRFLASYSQALSTENLKNESRIFSLVPELDRGVNFDNYFVTNNLTLVLEGYQQLMEFKDDQMPTQQTVYDEDVIKQYQEFYLIDVGIKELQELGNKSQQKSFTSKVIQKYSRQEKKFLKLIKFPYRAFNINSNQFMANTLNFSKSVSKLFHFTANINPSRKSIRTLREIEQI